MGWSFRLVLSCPLNGCANRKFRSSSPLQNSILKKIPPEAPKVTFMGVPRESIPQDNDLGSALSTMPKAGPTENRNRLWLRCFFIWLELWWVYDFRGTLRCHYPPNMVLMRYCHTKHGDPIARDTVATVGRIKFYCTSDISPYHYFFWWSICADCV